MTDDMPEMLLLRARGVGNIVLMGNDQFEALAALLAAHPAVAGDATAFAKAANHLAQGPAFEVIEDPAAFAKSYTDQIATETPGQPWDQGTQRLRDFGIPDFDSIKTPAITGDTLTFFVRDTLLGVPYEVTTKTDGSLPEDDAYNGLPLSPVPGETPAPAAVDADAPKPEAPDEDAVAVSEG